MVAFRNADVEVETLRSEPQKRQKRVTTESNRYHVALKAAESDVVYPIDNLLQNGLEISRKCYGISLEATEKNDDYWWTVSV